MSPFPASGRYASTTLTVAANTSPAWRARGRGENRHCRTAPIAMAPSAAADAAASATSAFGAVSSAHAVTAPPSESMATTATIMCSSPWAVAHDPRLDDATPPRRRAARRRGDQHRGERHTEDHRTEHADRVPRIAERHRDADERRGPHDPGESGADEQLEEHGGRERRGR